MPSLLILQIMTSDNFSKLADLKFFLRSNFKLLSGLISKFSCETEDIPFPLSKNCLETSNDKIKKLWTNFVSKFWRMWKLHSKRHQAVWENFWEFLPFFDIACSVYSTWSLYCVGRTYKFILCWSYLSTKWKFQLLEMIQFLYA